MEAEPNQGWSFYFRPPVSGQIPWNSYSNQLIQVDAGFWIIEIRFN